MISTTTKITSIAYCVLRIAYCVVPELVEGFRIAYSPRGHPKINMKHVIFNDTLKDYIWMAKTMMMTCLLMIMMMGP